MSGNLVETLIGAVVLTVATVFLLFAYPNVLLMTWRMRAGIESADALTS